MLFHCQRSCSWLFFFFFLIEIEGFKSIHWDYGEFGPDVWDEFYPQCNGTFQSPINIQTACTFYTDFPSFSFSDAHIENLNFVLLNNGHTIQAKTDSQLTLNGGQLNGTFVFDSFHLHWGPNHRTGSEHQINGQKLSGESHFVYQNPLTNERAVLSFLMKSRMTNSTGKVHPTSRDRSDQWTRFFDASHQLNFTGDTKNISLNLNLLMGTNFKDFWRYSGSLTTPPCTENVIWTIFKEEILLTDYDFQMFRHDLFFQSYRGPQPLFYRKVYRSFPHETLSNIPDQQRCLQSSSSSSSFSSLLVFFFFFVIFFFST